jgi:hypothetical protein
MIGTQLVQRIASFGPVTRCRDQGRRTISTGRPVQVRQFTATKKPETVDMAVKRRQRRVRRIDQQISLIKSAVHGVMPRASWVWMDEKADASYRPNTVAAP